MCGSLARVQIRKATKTHKQSNPLMQQFRHLYLLSGPRKNQFTSVRTLTGEIDGIERRCLGQYKMKTLRKLKFRLGEMHHQWSKCMFFKEA